MLTSARQVPPVASVKACTWWHLTSLQLQWGPVWLQELTKISLEAHSCCQAACSVLCKSTCNGLGCMQSAWLAGAHIGSQPRHQKMDRIVVPALLEFLVMSPAPQAVKGSLQIKDFKSL